MKSRFTYFLSVLVVPLSLILPAQVMGAPPNVAAGNIATFAGNGFYRAAGTPNDDGSLATAVALAAPAGLAMDASGDLYFADKNDNRVRKIDAAGKITTVAGNGTETPNPTDPAGDNGPATNASLKQPIGLAIDSSGNIYIVDLGNNRIRKVDAATHIITTFAGNGVAPPAVPSPSDPIGDGGPANLAQLDNPSSVAIDKSGNVYISDQSHRIVRKVDTNGIITTVAGIENTRGYSGDGGLATEAQLDSPESLAFDADSNLYIADQFGNRIRKVNLTSHLITTIAGNGVAPTAPTDPAGDNGLAINAQLNTPSALAFDAAGNLYINDQGDLRIRKVDTTGKITTVAGSGVAAPAAGDGTPAPGDGGPALNAKLSTYFREIVVSSNYLYIADFGNTVVRVVNLATPTSVQVTLASDTAGASFLVSGAGCLPGTYNAPQTLTWDANSTCSVTDCSDGLHIHDMERWSGDESPQFCCTHSSDYLHGKIYYLRMFLLSFRHQRRFPGFKWQRQPHCDNGKRMHVDRDKQCVLAYDYRWRAGYWQRYSLFPTRNE